MTAEVALTHPQPVKLTVEDYLLLESSGAFGPECKTELLDGAIYLVNSQHSEHFTVKNLLFRRLADACDALGTGLEAWSEGSIAMPPHSVPEPDIFITNERPITGLVRLDTVVLIAEVASTTRDYDLHGKAQLYAANGVPEYWVADVAKRQIRRFWRPGPESYASFDDRDFGERIEAATIPGLAVETAGI